MEMNKSNSSVDTEQIKLEISENLSEHNRIVPYFLTSHRVVKSIKEVLSEREKFYQKEFENTFKMNTCSMEYKLNMFYKKVNMVIDANKLTIYEINQNTKKDSELQTISNTKKSNSYPILILNFDQITAGVSVKQNSKKFKILVLGITKEFKFQAPNKEVFENVLIHLNYFIQRSHGAKTNLFGVALRKDFYKFYFINEVDYRNKAKTGDLLIFRGFECTARCQRCFTRAHYDHVALLYKKNDVLFVYESTAKDGCMLRTWREFTHFLWNLLYDKMVFRELRINMEEKQKKKFLDDIETNCDVFIKETQRKRYYLNCLNFFCVKKQEYEKKNEWAQADGFFCSQLVAAAYLKCKILKNKNGAAGFFPGSFADLKGNELELHDNFEFGPENIIEFSE